MRGLIPPSPGRNRVKRPVFLSYYRTVESYNTENYRYALGFKSIVGETGDNINVEILEATICTSNHMSKIREWYIITKLKKRIIENYLV